MKRKCSQLRGNVEMSNLYKCIVIYSNTLSSTKENKQNNIKNKNARKVYCYKIYLSGFITAVAVFRKPNTIPIFFSIDLVPNFLLSWLLVLLPSPFFLDVLFSFFPVVSIP
jgi:hypothetical protein